MTKLSAATPGAKHWDGTQALDYLYDDGGRAEAGFKGRAGDCVCRAIAIVTGRPYAEVYSDLAAGTGGQRASRGKRRSASARNGIDTGRKWFRDYMKSIGMEWTPTMLIGQGCRVHLLAGELPSGRLIVSLSKHWTAVIDGVIHDTYDPTRSTVWHENGVQTLTHRCVYGYWRAAL